MKEVQMKRWGLRILKIEMANAFISSVIYSVVISFVFLTIFNVVVPKDRPDNWPVWIAATSAPVVVIVFIIGFVRTWYICKASIRLSKLMGVRPTVIATAFKFGLHKKKPVSKWTVWWLQSEMAAIFLKVIQKDEAGALIEFDDLQFI